MIWWFSLSDPIANDAGSCWLTQAAQWWTAVVARTEWELVALHQVFNGEWTRVPKMKVHITSKQTKQKANKTEQEKEQSRNLYDWNFRVSVVACAISNVWLLTLFKSVSSWLTYTSSIKITWFILLFFFPSSQKVFFLCLVKILLSVKCSFAQGCSIRYRWSE